MNCFHFSVSLGYKTTYFESKNKQFWLWIAFIFQYLWDTKQQLNPLVYCDLCCELLSFFSIFGIQNNQALIPSNLTFVVNCFHFSVSLGYKTTRGDCSSGCFQLWIAFIFQYLWDTKQLQWVWVEYLWGCELLSFFSIFGIQNNQIGSFGLDVAVVNCFHFSVSLGYKTTLLIIYTY